MPSPFATRFLRDEAGAVTVDWVVLTASLIGMCLLAVTTIIAGATDASTGIGAQLGAADIVELDIASHYE